jgi:hypothetical protein
LEGAAAVEPAEPAALDPDPAAEEAEAAAVGPPMEKKLAPGV